MNMNCRKGYEVKLVDKQIVLTRDFARKAADAMSKQYATLMQVCAAYPTFTVVKYTINQKVGREKYGKLDYKNMEALIKEWVSENTEAALEEFEKIKREAACASGSYGIVKKWFLGKYKAQYIALHKAENCWYKERKESTYAEDELRQIQFWCFHQNPDHFQDFWTQRCHLPINGTEDDEKIYEAYGDALTIRYYKPRNIHQGLTFEQMENYIGYTREAEENLKRFQDVKELSKSQKSPYKYIKDWFLQEYSNYSATPEFDEDGFVVVKKAPAPKETIDNKTEPEKAESNKEKTAEEPVESTEEANASEENALSA